MSQINNIILHSRHLSSTPNQPGEVLEALQVSARLPFRAGVSKNLIFLTCTENQLGWLEGSSFGDALTLVMEQNIKVHHLSNMELHLRKGTAAKTMTSRILGYDKVGKAPHRNLRILQKQLYTLVKWRQQQHESYLSCYTVALFDISQMQVPFCLEASSSYKMRDTRVSGFVARPEMLLSCSN